MSDHRAESLTVQAAGLVQGIALVTFPAASGIFTSRTGYDLTSSQYGLMFAPQVVTAIVTSLLGAGLLWPRFTARVSEKGTYLRLPLRPAGAPGPPGHAEWHAQARTGLPAPFWVFGLFAFLYGICETMNGNWSQLDLASLGVKPATASLALTGFWAMVTIGRVLIAAIQRWLPSRAAYHGLPFLLAAAFVLIAALPHNAPGAAVAAFCLAGLGCSALLPLTISFGQEKLASYETAVAGGVIACYQCGYGVAAFGVGPLVSAGVRVPEIFAASAVVAGLMGLFSFAVARGRPSPATLHPRPMPARIRQEAR